MFICLLHTHVSDNGWLFDKQYRSPFLKIGAIFACFQSSSFQGILKILFAEQERHSISN